jgi:hypothetical protein
VGGLIGWPGAGDSDAFGDRPDGVDHGCRDTGGEGLDEEVAGARIEGAVVAVDCFGGRPGYARADGGEGVLHGKRCLGGVDEGAGTGGKDRTCAIDGADEVQMRRSNPVEKFRFCPGRL